MASFKIEDPLEELLNEIYSRISLADMKSLLRTSRSINSSVCPYFYKEAMYWTWVTVHRPSFSSEKTQGWTASSAHKGEDPER